MRLPSLFALAALGTLAACQTGQPDTERNPTTAATSDSINAPAPAVAVAPAKLARQLSPLMSGVWVKAAFIDALARTRSPLAVARTPAARDITAFSLDLRRAQADSVPFDAVLGTHEGGVWQVYLRPGRQAQALPLSYIDYSDESSRYELRYGLQNADTVLLLDKYDRQNRRRESVAYRRVIARPGRDGVEAMNKGLNLAVNQTLLAGRYTGVDSVGQPVQVQFTPDGRVTGLAPFRTYQINVDFIGPQSNLDKVVFNGYTPQQRDLAFRLSHDTLRLYATHPDKDEVELLLGRLHYTLVRRR